MRAYFGPKDVEVLKSADSARKTVDFGWYGCSRPLLQLLKWTYGWVGNFGVAISS